MKIKDNLFPILIVLSIVFGIGLIVLSSKSTDDWRLKYAENLEIDIEQFKTDIESDEVKKIVDDDIANGKSRGVNSTPSVFINEEKIEFKASFSDELDAKIQELLALDTNKILIEEFSDYQCPACKNYYDSTRAIYSEYKTESRIEWVFKNFPLSDIHPYAYDAAIAAEAVRKQNKFEEMQALLFSNNENLKNPKF